MHLQYSANIPIPTIWLKALPKGNNKKIYTYLKFSHMHLIYIVKTHSVSFFVKVVYITNIIFFFSNFFFFTLYLYCNCYFRCSCGKNCAEKCHKRHGQHKRWIIQNGKSMTIVWLGKKIAWGWGGEGWRKKLFMYFPLTLRKNS